MPKDLSRIVASRPQDRTAANVVRPGYHYEPVKAEGSVWFEECPPLFPVPTQIENPLFIDLTGKRFGHMFVIGYGGPSPVKKGARWVCRCLCGRFVLRNSTTLRKRDESKPNWCEVCNNTEHVRNGKKSQLKSVIGRSTIR